MFFKQLKIIGDNFSYIFADDSAREAAVIDPSFNGDAILKLVNYHDFSVKYIINTHHHKDHVADNAKLRVASHAKIVAHKNSRIEKDINMEDGDLLTIGSISIAVIHTPGHTPDSICLLIDKKLITGDTLFVGECGRTDLPGGSSEEMYNSLFHKLMTLGDNVEVYPGHDYGSRPYSTIGEEKRTNYALEKRSLGEFTKFMKTP